MTTDFLTPITKIWDSLFKRFGEERCYPILLAILLLAGLTPLAMPGIPAGHDIGFHLTRILSCSEGLRAGMFPAWINFHAIDGRGYGAGLFYSDIYFLPSAFLVAIGVPVVVACKFFIFSWVMMTGFSMYAVCRRISGNSFAGFAGALLYTWSSYFAVDIFQRAAMGEVMAFFFYPWIMLGLYELLFGHAGRFWILALAVGGMAYAHSINLVLVAIITGLLCLFNLPRLLGDIRRIFGFAAAGILAFGIAGGTLLPMLEQMYHIKFNLAGQTMSSPVAEKVTVITRLFLELPYMKMESWVPAGIGIIFLVTGCQRFRFKSERSAPECFRDIALLTGIFCLLSSTNFLPWEGMLSVLSSIQFPWRFFLPATAFLALGCGLTLGALCGGESSRKRYWVYILLFGCGFAWSFNVAYLYAAKIYEKNIFHTFSLNDSQRFATSGLHYLPMGKKLVDYAEPAEESIKFGNAAPDSYSLSRPKYGVTELAMKNLPEKSFVSLPLTPYYGYRAELIVNDEPIWYGAPDFRGGEFVVRNLPPVPDGILRLRYVNTRVQTLSLWGAFLCCAVALSIPFLNRKKRIKQ